MLNPFPNQNQTTGQYFFYADNGHYDVQISATGMTTYTLRYVRLSDAASAGNCALMQQAPATIPACIDAAGGWAFPQWWGGQPGSGQDSSTAIDAAIMACASAPASSGIRTATCSVRLTNGEWTIANQIHLYDPGSPAHPIWGLQVCGQSKYATQLTYRGPSTLSAIRMIGHSQKLCDVSVQLPVGTSAGWLDGIQYDGDTAIGISTMGKIADVSVYCNGHPGNGITFGRSHYQADQAVVDHPVISGCLSGEGLMILDSNALSITMISPAVAHCWVGAGNTVVPVGGAGTTGGSFAVIGGEFDDNDLNFYPGGGDQMTVTGVRSEGSKRTFDSAVGQYPHPVTFTNYQLASTYWWAAAAGLLSQPQGTVLPPRPPTMGTTVDATHLTLSVPNSVTWGDFIIIPGAGAAGADLHSHIASMTDPTHAILDIATVVTQVANVPVTLDTTRDQYNMYFAGGGPYVVTGSYFNSTAQTVNGTGVLEAAFRPPVGTLNLSGVKFRESFPNPNPLNLPTGASWGNVTWTGASHGYPAPVMMPDRFTTTGLPTLYFSSNAGFGANNEWVINSPTTPLAGGLRIIVVVDTYTLQAAPGINHIIFNGITQSVLNSSNGAYLTNAVPLVSIAEFVYAGSWRMIGR
jgi:hypothetical protein